MLWWMQPTSQQDAILYAVACKEAVMYAGTSYPVSVQAGSEAGTVAEGARTETFSNDRWQVFQAGCFAGGVQCLVTVPQEGVRPRP